MTQEEKIDALMEMVKENSRQDGQNNNFINRRGTSPFR